MTTEGGKVWLEDDTFLGLVRWSVIPCVPQRIQIALECFPIRPPFYLWYGSAKLIHFIIRRFEGELFLDVILISQSQKNRPRLRSARRRHAAIYRISRTEITHWTASPFEDCMHFIKTGTYKKNLVSFSHLASSNRRIKLRWRARVNWHWGQLAVVWGKITSK